MIKFGTDGWRALTDKDFTQENVALVSDAFARYLGKTDKCVVIGYDNRNKSELFANIAAKTVSSYGISVLLSNKSCPSQAVSYHVKRLDAAAGIMITASHNPPAWKLFKVKGPYGGAATPEITKGIEDMLSVRADGRLPQQPSPITLFDPKQYYIDELKSKINMKLVNQSVIIDPMYGSGIGYFGEILNGVIETEEIHCIRDILFGGINPEPIPPNVNELMTACKEKHLPGIAVDGDADRVGAVGSDGVFINTHQVFILLMYHLIKNKKMTGAIVKTFNMTKLVDIIAKHYNIKTYETPIGFKYVCDLMLKEDILMGGEESGGYGFKNHLPERDGILAGLYLMELMAYEKKPLEKVLDDISSQFGRYYYNRLDLHLDEAQKINTMNTLKNSPPKEFGGIKVVSIENLDGIKLNLENCGWILFRASGTEPLLRIYCESTSKEKVTHFLETARQLTAIQ